MPTKNKAGLLQRPNVRAVIVLQRIFALFYTMGNFGVSIGLPLMPNETSRPERPRDAAQYSRRRGRSRSGGEHCGGFGLGGHTVRVAPNGAEAVKRFDEMKYDLSFVDVRMPVMNGVDCFFAIRARHPEANIVLMTGFKEPAVEKALNAGALALLHKPFRMEEVMKIARRFA